MRLLLATLGATYLALIVSPVWAAESVTLTWTAPTQNTDGSELTDLASYSVYYGTVAGGPYGNSVTGVPAGNTTYVVENLQAGTWYFVTTAVNSAGVESEFSNEATKTIDATPQPPTNLTVVEDDLVAYMISQSADRLVLVPVGTVPPGTTCDGTMSVNGRHLVPRAAVQWAGSVRPGVVVAECGSGG